MKSQNDLLRYAQRARLPDVPCRAHYTDQHGKHLAMHTRGREDIAKALGEAIKGKRKIGKLFSQRQSRSCVLVFYDWVSVLDIEKERKKNRERRVRP
jgi:hypothetical protein